MRVGRQPSTAWTYVTEMCSGSEAGSYLRLTDSGITQIKAQGTSRTCNESKEGEQGPDRVLGEVVDDGAAAAKRRLHGHTRLFLELLLHPVAERVHHPEIHLRDKTVMYIIRQSWNKIRQSWNKKRQSWNTIRHAGVSCARHAPLPSTSSPSSCRTRAPPRGSPASFQTN